MKLDTANKVMIGVIGVGVITLISVYLYQKRKFQFIKKENETDNQPITDI